MKTPLAPESVQPLVPPTGGAPPSQIKPGTPVEKQVFAYTIGSCYWFMLYGARTLFLAYNFQILIYVHD